MLKYLLFISCTVFSYTILYQDTEMKKEVEKLKENIQTIEYVLRKENMKTDNEIADEISSIVKYKEKKNLMVIDMRKNRDNIYNLLKKINISFNRFLKNLKTILKSLRKVKNEKRKLVLNGLIDIRYKQFVKNIDNIISKFMLSSMKDNPEMIQSILGLKVAYSFIDVDDIKKEDIVAIRTELFTIA